MAKQPLYPHVTPSQARAIKEPWQMTWDEFEKLINWGAEPMAAIPGEAEEFIGKDWRKSPAALFSSDKDGVYIMRKNGTKVYNPVTKSEFFEDRRKAWKEYHWQEVRHAIGNIEHVPPEVLAEYEYYSSSRST